MIYYIDGEVISTPSFTVEVAAGFWDGMEINRSNKVCANVLDKIDIDTLFILFIIENHGLFLY